MKTSQICACVLLLVVGSVMAFADGINDPKIIVHGANPDSPLACPPKGCTDVGMSFTFSSPKGGSGALFFTNTSGKNWTSLTLIETGVSAADITCRASMFQSCSTKTLANGSVEILFSGVKHTLNPQTGILNGETFSMFFGCVGKDSCWPTKPISFSGQASAVPEPGTIALMVTGLGAIVSRRKRWKNRGKA